MSITFPASPSNGDTFTWGGTTYTYDSTPGLWIGSVSSDSGDSGGGGDPDWIRSFAEDNTLVSTGSNFSGTLFTAPASGNGTWGLLATGQSTTASNVNISTTDDATWGYLTDGTYLTGNGTLTTAQTSGNGGSRNAWVYLAAGDSLVWGFRASSGSYRYVGLE